MVKGWEGQKVNLSSCKERKVEDRTKGDCREEGGEGRCGSEGGEVKSFTVKGCAAKVESDDWWGEIAEWEGERRGGRTG